jgi:large subunit ribosomal protein L15
VVNIGSLAEAPAQSRIDRAWLEAKRLVRRPGPIKLLGTGQLKVALNIQVDAASASARKAVEAAGGALVLPAPKAKA